MNSISKMMMNFMKYKLPFVPKKDHIKTYSKVLFSTYLFYFMFNSKKNI